MTDFFASRHSDVYIHCEDYTSHSAPLPCRDAHSDAVNWSSASSFVSNSILSFALVSVSVCPCLQMCPSMHVLHVCASVSMTTLKQGQVERFFCTVTTCSTICMLLCSRLYAAAACITRYTTRYTHYIHRYIVYQYMQADHTQQLHAKSCSCSKCWMLAFLKQ